MNELFTIQYFMAEIYPYIVLGLFILWFCFTMFISGILTNKVNTGQNITLINLIERRGKTVWWIGLIPAGFAIIWNIKFHNLFGFIPYVPFEFGTFLVNVEFLSKDWITEFVDYISVPLSAGVQLHIYLTIIFGAILMNPRKIKETMKGKVTRGIRFIENHATFINLVTIEAKNFAKNLEKELKMKLPAFYTARVFFGKSRIPFFMDLEVKSIIYLGGAGSGKTVAIFEYIISILSWSKKNYGFTWIVYDMKHDFYTKMFRKGKDVLFFPNHALTAKWNPFREFHKITINESGEKEWELLMGKLKQFITYWIPTPEESSASRPWVIKSQKAAMALLITVSKSYDNPSMKDFIDFTMQYNTKEKMVEKIIELGYAQKFGYNISAILGDTEAGSNVYEILEQAITDLRILELYYSDEESDFSVAEFNKPLTSLTAKDIKTLAPKDRNMDKRLFLVQDADNQEYYSTAFRIILELQAKTLLSTKQDLDRRVFFLLDEAASLGKMTCIFDEIPEKGRSRGGALIVGLQTLAKFKSIYTEDIMGSILANIKSKVFMNIEDTYTQKWIKDYLDTTEFERDSVSTNEKQGGSSSYSLESRDTIKATELSSLPVNTCFIKMYSYLTKVDMRIQKMNDIVDFELNENIPTEFKTEFGQEEEENLNQRRIEIVNAITFLKEKTNKLITPQNINFIVKKNLESVVSTYNHIKEEQDQINKTINEMVNIEGYKNNQLSLTELSSRTGLKVEIISTIFKLIKIEEKELSDKVSKYKEKIEEYLTRKDGESDVKYNMRVQTELTNKAKAAGLDESSVRGIYLKIRFNSFLPDELPLFVEEVKKDVPVKETVKEEPSDDEQLFSGQVEVMNAPDEDIEPSPVAKQEDITDRIKKNEEEFRKRREEQEAKKAKERADYEAKRKQEFEAKKAQEDKEELSSKEEDEIDWMEQEVIFGGAEDEISLPEDQIVQDNPYHPHMD